MKFRFCGEGDCPDWVLAEIIATLSNLSAAKLEQLTALVAQKITGKEFAENSIKSIAADIADDGKSAVACLHFILMNATRYNANETVLQEELQQLGLPKPHAAAICRVFLERETAIRAKLVEASFKVNELTSVECCMSPDAFDAAQLKLCIAQQLVAGLPEDTTHTLHIDGANLATLLQEMREARTIMQRYSASNGDAVANVSN